MSLSYKSDKIVVGIVMFGCGSLLSGAYILDQLNLRNNKTYTLKDTKSVISIVCWPITLPYTLLRDDNIGSIKLIS